MKTSLFGLLLLATITGCSEESDAPAAAGPDPGAVTDGCPRGTLESDMASLPWTGPKIDSSGKLMPPPAEGYVVSSTFLRLRPGDEAGRRFGELFAPIATQLQTQPGLEALQLATSASCGTARTLSVWASQEAMYDFVVSDAHYAAVRAVSEVSRGGSIVVHWSAQTVEQASWDEATKRLTAAKGPFY
jgi:heme-degrading monooxygenase HmoA